MSLAGGTFDLTNKVTHLTTICLCQGYIWPKVSLTQCLTKCQPDLKPHLGGTSHQRSAWLNVNLIWSLIEGVHLTKISLTQSVIWSTWLEAWSLGSYIWPKVSLTQSLPKCQPDPKPDPGGISDQRSAWPKIYPNVNLTQGLIMGGISD